MGSDAARDLGPRHARDRMPAVALAVSREPLLEPFGVAGARPVRGDGGELELGLPCAPRLGIAVHDGPFRPEPRLGRDAEGGVATSVGRVGIECPARDGLAIVALPHDTRLGAAHGAVLVAEHRRQLGLL
jgi:aspartate-semialdehyde dehydrogenase